MRVPMLMQYGMALLRSGIPRTLIVRRTMEILYTYIAHRFLLCCSFEATQDAFLNTGRMRAVA